MTDATPHDWVSTATLSEIAARLRAASRVVTLTHAKPDGDAFGSTLAVARSLRSIGKDVTTVYTGGRDRRFDALFGVDAALWASADVASHARIPDADVALVSDTGAWSQLADVRPWLEPRSGRAVALDHHHHGDPGVAPTRFVDRSAAAVCQPAAALCCDLLGVRGPASLPVDVAEPLYVGLATDTGWFRHPNTTESVLRLAADLYAAGVDHPKLYRMVELQERTERTLLIGRALCGLRLHNGGRHAVMVLTAEDFAQTGADRSDASGFTDIPMRIAHVEAAVLLHESEPGRVKASLRSKTIDGAALDVNLVCRRFGGGGHKQAAGARFDATIDAAVEQVTRAMLEEAGSQGAPRISSDADAGNGAP